MHLSNALRMLMSALSVRLGPCPSCGYFNRRNLADNGHNEGCALKDVLEHPDYAAWRAGECMPAEPPRGERQTH